MTRYTPGIDRSGYPCIWRKAMTAFGAEISYELSLYGAQNMIDRWATDPEGMAEMGFSLLDIREMEEALRKVEYDAQGV